MNPFRELLAIDHRQALEFFTVRLQDIAEPDVDREELLSKVWEDDVFVTVRGVDTLVKRLRRKIEADPSHPTRVVTAWGAGYKFGEA